MVNEGLSFQVELLELLAKDWDFLASLFSYFLFFLGNSIHRHTFSKTWWLGKKALESGLPRFGDLSFSDLRGENLCKFLFGNIFECCHTFLRIELIFSQTLHFDATLRLGILVAFGSLTRINFSLLAARGDECLGDFPSVDFTLRLP